MARWACGGRLTGTSTRRSRADHEWDPGEMEHPGLDVRRAGSQRGQVAGAGAERARHLGGVLVDDPDAPAADVEIDGVGPAVDDRDRTRWCAGQPVADPGWRAHGDHVT